MATFDDPRISAILRGRREIRRVPFPTGKADAPKIEIGVRILTDDEQDIARLNAQRYVERVGCKIVIDPEMFDRAYQREVVSLAFFDVDTITAKDPRPFFPDADAVRSLDPVLVVSLFEIYADQQDYVNPALSLSPEQITELRDRLGKEQSAEGLLSVLDARSLRSLLRSMGAALAK